MTKRRDRRPAGDQAVYGMAVASELTGVNPAMLRAYEARGLLRPRRTDGGTRRYSADDIEEVHRITELLDEGLNLAGVELVRALEQENQGLRAEVERLRSRLAALGEPDQPDQEGQAEPRGTL